MEKLVLLLGRLLLSAIFLVTGVQKILDFSGSRRYMEDVGISMAGILLVGAIVLELIGGLAVLLGYKARLGAILLIVFLVPATLACHADFGGESQLSHFLKNLSILGGLLLVAGSGPGPYALDRKGR